MTDPAMAPEAPNVAETVRFLRRFADLMSNGQNSAYLLNAAVLLETLAARVTAASGEDELWRHKCESLAEENERLETECEGLKHDIDGHLELARSLLGERETLAVTLAARDAELGELGETLTSAREQFAATSQAQERLLAELRQGYDHERDALISMAAARDEELGRLREAFAGEREQSEQQLQSHEAELAELRRAFAEERDELQSKITSQEGQLAVLRGEAERESEALKARIAALEATRAELRSALRLSDLGIAATGSGDGPAPKEDSALVPTATLRHARAQFEYLARESVRRGDVATQVMCELGAHTLELALKEGERTGHSTAGQIALSILEPGQAASVVSDTP
jgi:chromosome segregation ATPase